jgi:hypothetical protein
MMKNLWIYKIGRSWDSSISTVSDYRLDWVTGIRFQAEAKDSSSSCCAQTSSEAHSASYQWVLGVLSQG